jgi:hypothetical protein
MRFRRDGSSWHPEVLVRKGFAGSVGWRAGVDDCELAGYRSGLPAGLGRALADLADTDPVAAARDGLAAVRTRLTRPDGRVARLFWRDGRRPDHPVRVLFAGGLVATMWVGT